MLKKLKYEFQRPELLTAALTHRSARVNAEASGELADGSACEELDNQRLEFLGDAVLELVISQDLFHREPQLSEGEMSRFRAGLVREARLAEIAKKLGLGEALILGPGEAHGGGRQKPSVLADALEALLGAIFLDGGFGAAEAVIGKLWAAPLKNPAGWGRMLADHKTRLQEDSQGRGLGAPVYELVKAEGPPHSRVFTMALWLGGEKLAQASAGTKKEAEQKAAQKALKKLEASQWRVEPGDGKNTEPQGSPVT